MNDNEMIDLIKGSAEENRLDKFSTDELENIFIQGSALSKNNPRDYHLVSSLIQFSDEIEYRKRREGYDTSARKERPVFTANMIIIALFLAILFLAARLDYLLGNHIYESYMNAAGHQTLKLRGEKAKPFKMYYRQIAEPLEYIVPMSRGMRTDGYNNYYSRANDLLLALRFDADDVYQTSAFIYRIMDETGEYNPERVALAGEFLKIIFPDWNTINDDIVKYMNEARLKPAGDIFVVRNNKRVDFRYVNVPCMRLGSIAIVVEAL